MKNFFYVQITSSCVRRINTIAVYDTVIRVCLTLFSLALAHTLARTRSFTFTYPRGDTHALTHAPTRACTCVHARPQTLHYDRAVLTSTRVTSLFTNRARSESEGKKSARASAAFQPFWCSRAIHGESENASWINTNETRDMYTELLV